MSALVIDETISPAEREDWDARLQDPETWRALKASAERMLARLGYSEGTAIGLQARVVLLRQERDEARSHCVALNADLTRALERAERADRERDALAVGKLRPALEGFELERDLATRVAPDVTDGVYVVRWVGPWCAES